MDRPELDFEVHEGGSLRMLAAIAERCNAVEECYEFMLAYAAQGLPTDHGSESGRRIREFLGRAVDAGRRDLGLKLPEEILRQVADAARAAAHGGSATIDARRAAAPAAPWTDAELFSEAARRAAAADPFALCTVIGTARSVPRDAGAKMLVAPNGSICGTVGGGPLEASVIFEAVQLLRDGGAAGIRRFALTASGDAADPLPASPTTRDDLGMKCGGEVSIFVDVVRPAARLVVYGAGHVGERVEIGRAHV